MATVGDNRNIEQINNKLKKLKKEYRDQKKKLGWNKCSITEKSPFQASWLGAQWQTCMPTDRGLELKFRNAWGDCGWSTVAKFHWQW